VYSIARRMGRIYILFSSRVLFMSLKYPYVHRERGWTKLRGPLVKKMDDNEHNPLPTSKSL
jgi:hypothetical protein